MLGPRGKKRAREASVQFRWYRWKLKGLKQLRKTALGFGGWSKGHGEELGKQTSGKELKAFLGILLPRGCYVEVM